MIQNEINKNTAKWIESCEESFREKFSDIAEDISKRRGLRIVRLFGPSCSGKTTAADILISLFEAEGKQAHVISIDDFFFERDILIKRSRDLGLDGIDYDSPETIDCKRLSEFVEEIFEGGEVHCPVYDFKIGKADTTRSMTVDGDDIFIFEGIQAVYPNVMEILSSHGSASIYIAPQRALESCEETFQPNELRFMRRIVRDYHFRGSTPEFISMLWESVRENEEKNIFPYVGGSDYTVDSVMDYEIGVLRPYLADILSKMDKKDKHYADLEKILKKVEKTPEISSKYILDGMLYCEFV